MMKCRFCNKETDIDTGYTFGFKQMVVCGKCVDKIIRGFNIDEVTNAMIILSRISNVMEN